MAYAVVINNVLLSEHAQSVLDSAFFDVPKKNIQKGHFSVIYLLTWNQITSKHRPSSAIT